MSDLKRNALPTLVLGVVDGTECIAGQPGLYRNRRTGEIGGERSPARYTHPTDIGIADQNRFRVELGEIVAVEEVCRLTHSTKSTKLPPCQVVEVRFRRGAPITVYDQPPGSVEKAWLAGVDADLRPETWRR